MLVYIRFARMVAVHYTRFTTAVCMPRILLAASIALNMVAMAAAVTQGFPDLFRLGLGAEPTRHLLAQHTPG